MRAATVGAAVAVALGMFPGRAAAFDYSGRIGFRYDRSDTWAPTGDHTKLSSADLAAGLDFAGFLSSPKVLRFAGGVAYGQASSDHGPAVSTSRSLGYRLSLALFDFRGSKLAIGAGASQGKTDNAVESDAGVRTTGTTTERAYSAGVRASPGPGLGLGLGATRRESTNESFGRQTVTQTSNEFTGTFRHGLGPYQYLLGYTGVWNESSLDSANFALHAFNLSGGATLGTGVTGSLTSRYLLRVPSTVNALNPRVETGTVDIGTQWRPGANVSSSTSYVYAHSTLTAPGMEPRETLTHGLTTWAGGPLSSRWSGGAGLGLSLVQDRLGTREERDMGQTASISANWERAAETETSGLGFNTTLSAGVTEPRTGGALLGYGGLARVRLSSRTGLAPLSYTGGYQVDYSQDVFGRRGWSLVQSASATATTVLGEGARVAANVTAVGTRRSTPLFGDRSNRGLSASANLRWRQYDFLVTASADDGVTGALSQSAAGDGLFYPEKFDTHSRQASAQLTASLSRRLSATAIGRYIVLSGPTLPDQHEASAWGMLRYSLGRIDLSLEDRYSVSGATALDNRANLLMFRISRTFGGRF